MPTIFTANLGRGVSEAEFLRNVQAIDDEAGAGAIIGFQEIDEDDLPNEHAGLRKLLRPAFSFAGWDSRVPIATGSKWAHISEETIHASAGLAIGRVGLSPERKITELVTRHARKGLPPLVVLDTHFPRNDPRLLGRWRSVESKLQKRIARWYARGYTVIWMADANRAVLPKMHPLERTLAHERLDWVRVVEHPQGLQVERVDTGSIELTIDGHNALWAQVRLSPPSKEKR